MPGGMAERLKAAVLKTVSAGRYSGVRIPLPPPIRSPPSLLFHTGAREISGRARFLEMRYFFVALWSRQTEAVLQDNVRLTNLGEAVDTAARKFAEISSAEFDGPFKSIFVAPEYLFTTERSEADNTPRALTTDQVKGIAKELKEISRAHMGMLMLPGSVIYQHAIEKQTGGKTAAVSAVQTYQSSLNPDGAKGLVKTARQNLVNRNDDASPALKLQQLSQANNITHVVKNRLYVLLDANVVAKYGKKADKNEVMGPRTALFIPGQDTGLPEIGGIRFGFEICFDHELGVLKAMSNDAKVDIHIVISAWTTNNVSNMQLRSRGYFLHASSAAIHTAVYFKPARGLAQPVTQETISTLNDLNGKAIAMPDVNCAGGILRCYKLPYFPP